MSLNNILLHPQLLSSLYSNVLIESSVATSVSDSQPLRYLGNNEKKILLFVSHSDVVFLSDSELQFLSNILSACKLGLNDVAIVNTHKLNVNMIDEVVAELDPKTVFLFGIEPLAIGLPINFPQFQLQQFNKRTYLYSPDLFALENDKALKAKLWNCLKALFGI